MCDLIPTGYRSVYDGYARGDRHCPVDEPSTTHTPPVAAPAIRWPGNASVDLTRRLSKRAQ